MQIRKLVPILTVLLCACSHSDDVTVKSPAVPGGGGPGGGGTAQMKDVTDTSSCKGTASPDTNIYRTWHIYYAGDNVNIDMAFNVGAYFTTVTDTCTYPDGQSLQASVTVPSTVTGNQLTLTKKDSQTTTGRSGGDSFDCSVSINAVAINYDFSGNCLEVRASNGQIGYMVP